MKTQMVQIRMSEQEVLMLNNAVADLINFTGEIYNRSDVIRLALDDYYLKLNNNVNRLKEN